MANDITKQSALFKALKEKAVVARFDQEQASSDGGAVLLKGCDERLDLSEAMASCLQDDRQRSCHSRKHTSIGCYPPILLTSCSLGGEFR